MNDDTYLAIVGIPAIVVAYGIHSYYNPGTDGAILAGVSSTIVGIITYVIGQKRGRKKAKLDVVQ